jgi:hypothetical protein
MVKSLTFGPETAISGQDICARSCVCSPRPFGSRSSLGTLTPPGSERESSDCNRRPPLKSEQPGVRNELIFSFSGTPRSDTEGSISSGHRPFYAILDAATVTTSQVISSRLRCLKERITAATHQHYVYNYCRETRPFTVFQSTDRVRPSSHHSVSLQGACLA